MPRSTPILGLAFFHESLEKALQYSHEGGLFVFPSGPCLAELDRDIDYYKALKASDYIVVDSGLLSLAWRILKGLHLYRISGYAFLKHFLNEKRFREQKPHFWVMPNQPLMQAYLAYLQSQGLETSAESCYVAPDYRQTSVEDDALLSLIKAKRPHYIIITIGGGVQEKLGAFLKTHLDYKPTILCIGAAIAFLCGAQARIPLWADRLYLGWLFRIFNKPSVFLKRYFKAWRLVKVLLYYREKSPI